MMLGVVVFCILIFLIYLFTRRSPAFSLLGRHVLITGGSSGIGLSLAMEARRRGANVTIVARSVDRLREAVAKIETVRPDNSEGGWVHSVSLDLTASWDTIGAALTSLVEDRGVVHVLINCAGFAEAFYFSDATEAKFQRLMSLNFFGCVAVSHALLPSMREDAKKNEGQGGCICFISSMAGQIGVFGYTAYCGSKFALRGFAETLYWELLSDGISVTVGFPPDTDTPGYELEKRGKPAETEAISQAAGLVQPEPVAKKLLQDVCERRFMSGLGFDGFFLSTLSAGMAPTDSLFQLVFRSIVCGPLHMIGEGYRFWMRCVIRATAAKQAEAAAQKQD